MATSNLNVVISSNIAGLRAGLTNATRDIRRFGNETKSRMTSALGGLKGQLLGAVSGSLFTALGVEADNAFTKLKIQTGIVGKEFEALKETSYDLFQGGLANDLGQATQAVSLLTREMGLVGDELEQVSKGGLLIANSFDKDVNETLRATTALMKNYSITGEEANNTLLRALQLTGDQYDDLFDTVNEYSLQLSQAGLGYKDFINILVNGTQLGLRNTDELADLMRENVIRITDGSDKTRAAFKKLGLSYEKDYIDVVKKNGGDISVLMEEISKKVLEVKDPIDQVTIGVDLFGTKFEDNGVKIIESMTGVEDKLGDVNGLVDKNADLVAGKLTSSWKNFTGGLSEFIEPLIPMLTWFLDLITAMIKSLEFLIRGVVGGLSVIGQFVGLDITDEELQLQSEAFKLSAKEAGVMGSRLVGGGTKQMSVSNPSNNPSNTNNNQSVIVNVNGAKDPVETAKVVNNELVRQQELNKRGIK